MDKKGYVNGGSKDLSSKNGIRRDSSMDFTTSSKNRKGSNIDEKGNLWQSILNSVALRDDVRETHLIVLGDRSSGKRSLIQSINKNSSKTTLKKFND